MQSRKAQRNGLAATPSPRAPVRAASDPRVAGILHLQRTIGNQAVVALLRSGARPPARRLVQRELDEDATTFVAEVLFSRDPSAEQMQPMVAWLQARFDSAEDALALIASDYDGLKKHGARDAGYALAPPGKAIGERFPTLESMEQYASTYYTVAVTSENPEKRLAALPRSLRDDLEIFAKYRSRLPEYPELRDRVYKLIRWYAPLKTRDVSSIPNKKGAMQAMRSELAFAADELKAQVSGTRPSGQSLPTEALISHDPPNEDGYGVRSAVITALPGALRSGDKTEGGLTEVEKAIRTEQGTKIHQGHLVARALGGKNAGWNITPLSEGFNTGAMKNFETIARNRLERGLVIAYETKVDYEYGLPVKLSVTLETRRLREGGTSTKIRDWWLPEEGSQTSKTFTVQWPKPRTARPVPALAGVGGSTTTTTTTTSGGPYDSDGSDSSGSESDDDERWATGIGSEMGWGSGSGSESEGKPRAKRQRR